MIAERTVDRNIVKAILGAGLHAANSYADFKLAQLTERDEGQKEMRRYNLDKARTRINNQKSTINALSKQVEAINADLKEKKKHRELGIEEAPDTTTVPSTEVERKAAEAVEKYMAMNAAYARHGLISPDTQKRLDQVINQFMNSISSGRVYRKLIDVRSLFETLETYKDNVDPAAESLIDGALRKLLAPDSVAMQGEVEAYSAHRGYYDELMELRERLKNGSALTPQKRKRAYELAQALQEFYIEEANTLKEILAAHIQALGILSITDSNGRKILSADPDFLLSAIDMSQFDLSEPVLGNDRDTTEGATEAQEAGSIGTAAVDTADEVGDKVDKSDSQTG